MVQIDEMTLMLIGGRQGNTDTSSKVKKVQFYKLPKELKGM